MPFGGRRIFTHKLQILYHKECNFCEKILTPVRANFSSDQIQHLEDFANRIGNTDDIIIDKKSTLLLILPYASSKTADERAGD